MYESPIEMITNQVQEAFEMDVLNNIIKVCQQYAINVNPEELKKALEGTDIEDIKKKSEDLQKIAMDLGAKVYEEAAKANAQTESKSDNDETDNGSSDKNDGVEEAHYEEK